MLTKVWFSFSKRLGSGRRQPVIKLPADDDQRTMD